MKKQKLASYLISIAMLCSGLVVSVGAMFSDDPRSPLVSICQGPRVPFKIDGSTVHVPEFDATYPVIPEFEKSDIRYPSAWIDFHEALHYRILSNIEGLDREIAAIGAQIETLAASSADSSSSSCSSSSSTEPKATSPQLAELTPQQQENIRILKKAKAFFENQLQVLAKTTRYNIGNLYHAEMKAHVPH